MTESYLVVLRHRLNLQAEDAQLVHHPWHTVGHHTEVFGTNEHSCCLCQSRQFLHCLIVPELVVATIEIVVVQSVEEILV